MVSDLNKLSDKASNPFIAAKMDKETIRNFKFPKDLKTSQNPYKLRKDGLYMGKSVSIAIAQELFCSPNHFNSEYVENGVYPHTFTTSSENSLRVPTRSPPKLLFLLSNTVELLRLRKELILCLSECAELAKIYID